MVPAVVLGDPMVMMMMMVVVPAGERDRSRAAADQGRDKKCRGQSLCLDEHLFLLSGFVGQVVKLLMARSSTGASTAQCDGGAAATITVVAERPETMQAISRKRLPLLVR